MLIKESPIGCTLEIPDLHTLNTLLQNIAVSGTGGGGDDTLAFQAAVDRGGLIDGGGRIYNIRGMISPGAANGKITNCRFVQLDPLTTATIQILNKTDWEISGCTFDCGGHFLSGSLSNYCINVEGLDRVRILYNRIYNGGPMSVCRTVLCEEVKIIGNTIEDFTVDTTPEPADDIIQGYYVQACHDVVVMGNTARRFKAYITPAGGPNAGIRGLYVLRNRGYAFGGIDAGISNDTMVILGNIAEEVDQGFDTTGTYGSSNVTFSNNIGKDNGTYDFKFTNATRHYLITSNHSIRAGKIGLVVTSSSNILSPAMTTLLVIGNLIEDTGADGLWTDGTWATGGTHGMHINAGAFNPPKGLGVTGNFIIDTVGHSHHGIIFQNLDPVGEPDSTVLLCELYENNTVYGGLDADFSGGHVRYVELTSAGSENAADGAWLPMALSTETYDSANLHSTAINNTLIHATKSGTYEITARALIPAAANGVRKMRLVKVGVEVPGSMTIFAPHATEPTTVNLSTHLYLTRDQYFNVQIFQNSGGALSIDRAEYRVTCKYLGP